MEHVADRPVLAIDLGGTRIRAAIITPDHGVHARRTTETRDEQGVEAVLDRVCELARAVRAEAAEAGLPEPAGIGIAAPGPLDPWAGVVREPPNLQGWRDVPIASHVAAELALPTFLERDTNVAVMAEWRHGAGSGTGDVIYVTVSTGVGGGIVSGGQPLIGPHGLAGEVGHVTVELDGPRCGCGGIGHVEAISSGTALAREARRLLEEGSSAELARLVARGEEVDGKLVARAAEAGDPACVALLERAWLGIGALCGSLVNLLSPEVIVIGGAIARHHPRLFEVARAELRRRALPILQDRVRIEPARLGDDVSLVGALPIVNDRIGDPAFAARSQEPPPAAEQQGAIRS